MSSSASETLRFSEGNLFVRVLENVRGRDVFLVQGTAFPANDNFVELLFWIDALQAGQRRVRDRGHPVLQLRQGRQEGRAAGLDPGPGLRRRDRGGRRRPRRHAWTCTPRRSRASSTIPVDDLYALPMLCEAIASKALADLVVVSPDAGFAKKARVYAPTGCAPLAIADKERVDHTETAKCVDLIGDGRGPNGADRRRLHDLGRHAGRRGPRLHRAGRPSVYAMP